MLIFILYWCADYAGIAPHPMPTSCLFFLGWELMIEIVCFTFSTLKGSDDAR